MTQKRRFFFQGGLVILSLARIHCSHRFNTYSIDYYIMKGERLDKRKEPWSWDDEARSGMGVVSGKND